MAATNDLVLDNTIIHTINLMRFEAGERKKIVRLLRDLNTELSGILAQDDLTKFSKRRLQALERFSNALIDTTYREISDEMERDLQGVASAEGRAAVRGINSSVGVDLATVYVAPSTLKALAGNTLIEGAPSSAWWARQIPTVQRRFMDTVRMGILQGMPTPAIVRMVREQVFPWKRRNAEAIVRTSVQAVANNVRMETYKFNSSVVKGVRAVVTLDTRTSRLCMSRSGNAWDLDGKPIKGTDTKIPFPGPPPWHWNCRTTLTGVLKSWDELGSSKKIKEISRSTRASMDGQVPADLNYEEWLRIKDKAEPGFAREVLGPGRYTLWKKGDLSLRDLVDQTGRELRLDELA